VAIATRNPVDLPLPGPAPKYARPTCRMGERHKQVYQDLMPDVIILLHLCAFVLPLPVLDLAKPRGSSCLFLFSFYSCSATDILYLWESKRSQLFLSFRLFCFLKTRCSEDGVFSCGCLCICITPSSDAHLRNSAGQGIWRLLLSTSNICSSATVHFPVLNFYLPRLT
jgi:hypothetical protein